MKKRIRIGRITFNCEYCDKKTSQTNSQYMRMKHHFCSSDCSGKYKKKFGLKGKKHPIYRQQEVNCANCGEVLMRALWNIQRSKRFYCNRQCMTDYNNKMGLYKDSNNSNWKGGITSLSDSLRKTPEYIDWFNRIVARDGGICQECGCNENLDIHHIIEFNQLIRKYNIDSIEKGRKEIGMWNTDNGVTLCVHCHADRHPDKRGLILRRIA